MKADEIRKILRDWPMEDLLKLYTQTYRRLPKTVKEEMDEVIREGFQKKSEPKPKQPVRRTMAELVEAIDVLIDYAEKGLYYDDNRTVSKKERSGWRFTVRQFIQELTAYRPEEPEYDESNRQLCRIYQILGRSTMFYTFVSQDPYHALGYESQRAFLSIICDRIRAGSCDDEMLTELIRVGCNGLHDGDTTSDEIIRCLIEHFPDDLDRMLHLTEKLFEPVNRYYEQRYNKRGSTYLSEDYMITSNRYKDLGWFKAATLSAMQRYDDAYTFVMDVHFYFSPEVDLYCLLTYYIPDGEGWMSLYERALKDGIKPRDSLQMRYGKMKAGR